jgi:hypothetical protein
MPFKTTPDQICTSIDSSQLCARDFSLGIYTTSDTPKHPLSESTVLDNCGAIHLVNSVRFLESGSFHPATGTDTVEAGTSTLEIIGYGTRRLKNALHGERGKNTEDLILKNVAVVDQFHVNIVSEALLQKTGAWYCGKDITLRYGTLENSVPIADLTRNHNLVFLEYKPLSFLYSEARPTPTSEDSMANSQALAVARTRPFRPSWDEPPDRQDSISLWHIRSGHLGARALEMLIDQGRGVKIKGMRRIECDSCSKAYATKRIQRAPSENRSPRPYFRIFWDLFVYEQALDGSLYALVIGDEYSGRLHAFPLRSKTQEDVSKAIQRFETYVHRQYEVRVCKIRQDAEAAVISLVSDTAYMVWAKEAGIELEIAPPRTSEANGGSERAGKTLIEKALVLLLGANLPAKLWAEAIIAAAYLHNMSPALRKNGQAPNTLLHQWFNNYFRWYQPLEIRSRLESLLPNWGNVYAYGCKAYALVRERENNTTRRYLKTHERAHIGYLVGYVASNIFRIWIPARDEVISSRNVVFKEDSFYKGEQDELENGLSTSDAQEVAIEISSPEEIKDVIYVAYGASDDPHEDQEQQLPEFPARGHEGSGPSRESSGVGTQETQNEDSPSSSARPECPDQGLPTPEGTPDPDRTVQRNGAPSANSLEPFQEARHLETSGNQENRTYQRRTQREIWGTRPTRHSNRLRNRNQSPSENDTRPKSVFAVGLQKDTRAWTQFTTTYLPTQLQREVESRTKDKRLETLNCVFTAAVTQPHPGPDPAIKPRKEGKHVSELPPEPTSWKGAQNGPFKEQWLEAMKKELRSLVKLGVWRTMEREKASSQPLPLKWVYKYKLDEDGYLTSFKARICIRGDLQPLSTTESTYAATLAAKSFRVMMAVAARFDLEVDQLDVTAAFLNANRDGREPVFCQLPDGFKEEGKCGELRRALYGLRDSPLLWQKEFSATLVQLGLQPSPEEPCLFTSSETGIMLLFYVDDILILYPKERSKECKALKEGIKARYEVKDQGSAEWFLGVRILRDRKQRTITLIHDSYIDKVARKFGLAENPSFLPTTPMVLDDLAPFEGQASREEIKAFQERVGSILYTAVTIRPDVAFACARLSRALTNPGPAHLKAADRVIEYLYSTRFLGIQYGGCEKGSQALLIAGDASFADDQTDRKSTHGYIITLFGGPIHWKSSKQPTVSTSTTEAELLVLELTAKEAMALKRLFRDIRLDLGEPWKIYCDNQQTIRLIVSEAGRLNTKLRHVDIQQMWLKQEFKQGSFQVTYLETTKMPADGLTKPLPRAQFERFREHLNLKDVRKQIS